MYISNPRYGCVITYCHLISYFFPLGPILPVWYGNVPDVDLVLLESFVGNCPRCINYRWYIHTYAKTRMHIHVCVCMRLWPNPMNFCDNIINFTVSFIPELCIVHCTVTTQNESILAPLRTHRDQMCPQVAHWVLFRFYTQKMRTFKMSVRYWITITASK